jgi:hypothetical protein
MALSLSTSLSTVESNNKVPHKNGFFLDEKKFRKIWKNSLRYIK